LRHSRAFERELKNENSFINMKMKQCRKCGNLKPFAEYHKNKCRSDGHVDHCKQCIKERYQEKNKETIDAKNKRMEHNKKHKKAKVKDSAAIRYQRHKDRIKKLNRQRSRSQAYREKRQEREKKRYESDPAYKASKNFRARIHKALKNNIKKTSTINLLGCSIEHARQHLESQFTHAMSWDNHGVHGWHIDHITPCHSFDLSDPEQQRQCFHYTNLQPLWASDNQSKGNTIPDNHQPQLPIAI